MMDETVLLNIDMILKVLKNAFIGFAN